VRAEVRLTYSHTGLPLSFLSWAYVRQEVYFWAYATPRYRFSAFSYAKSSDFRHNFRLTRNDKDVQVVLDIRHITSTQILSLIDQTDIQIIMKVMQSGRQTVRQPFYFGRTRTPGHLILGVLATFSGV